MKSFEVMLNKREQNINFHINSKIIQTSAKLKTEEPNSSAHYEPPSTNNFCGFPYLLHRSLSSCTVRNRWGFCACPVRSRPSSTAKFHFWRWLCRAEWLSNRPPRSGPAVPSQTFAPSGPTLAGTDLISAGAAAKTFGVLMPYWLSLSATNNAG